MADNKQTNEVMDFLRNLFAPDTFENPEFGRMRIIREGNKFLFCAKDVAVALGYKDPTNAIKAHCRRVVKHHLPHPQSPNKQVEANFIPEGDVYRLITHSKLPNAEKFEHWVFDEIAKTVKTTDNINDKEQSIVLYNNDTLKIFENEQFGQIRTLMIEDEIWFVLKDVCEALDIGSPHKVADRLDEDERNQIPVIDTLGRQQLTTIINEAGLYNVVLRSDKPSAKVFKRWVTHDVIPTIHRTGSYNPKSNGADYKIVYEQTMQTIQDMMMPVVESVKILAPIVTDLTHRVDKLEHTHYNVGSTTVLPSISGMSAKEWSDYQIRNVKVIAYSQGKTEKEVLSSIYRAMEDRNKVVLREQIKNESGSVFAAVGRNHSLRYMFDEAMNAKLQGYGLSPARIPIRDGQ